MTDQLDLFDLKEGRRRKDAAMAQVDDHAGDEAKARMDEAIREMAYRRPHFTSDEPLRLAIDRGWALPREPRAWGPAFKRAATRGLIRKVKGVVSESVWASCHRRPKQVWRSLVIRS